jgi:hypothetical protein
MKFKRKNSSETAESKGIIVGTGLAPRKFPTLKLKVPAFFKGRIKILALVFVILLVGIGCSLFILNNREDNQPAVACSDEILKEAAPNLESAKARQLEGTVNKIEALSSYKRDPNCLNITITYYVEIGDFQAAKKNLDALELVYDPAKKFSELLSTNARNIETLRNNVATLSKSNEHLNDYQKKRTLSAEGLE